MTRKRLRKENTMAHPTGNTYDATRDPRTGRPILPIDADNTNKADAESVPLTDEDNQGIDIGNGDSSTVGEEDDLPREMSNKDDEELVDEETRDQESIEGERPEALAKFAEVARNDDGLPVRTGTEATAETAPIPTDPTQKQDAATKVLREGVLKQEQGADEAIDRLPDRTDPRDHLPKRQ
jgi:hypothetical protein